MDQIRDITIRINTLRANRLDVVRASATGAKDPEAMKMNDELKKLYTYRSRYVQREAAKKSVVVMSDSDRELKEASAAVKSAKNEYGKNSDEYKEAMKVYRRVTNKRWRARYPEMMVKPEHRTPEEQKERKHHVTNLMRKLTKIQDAMHMWESLPEEEQRLLTIFTKSC